MLDVTISISHQGKTSCLIGLKIPVEKWRKFVKKNNSKPVNLFQLDFIASIYVEHFFIQTNVFDIFVA